MIGIRVCGGLIPTLARRSTAVKAAAIAVVMAGVALGAQQAPPAAGACTISGTITGLGGPLPGVSITVRRDDIIQTAASTDVDGRFRLSLPDASYQLTAELTGFDSILRDVTVRINESREGIPADRQMCAQAVDLTMTLTPRTAGTTPRNGQGAAASGRRAGGPPPANETAEAAAQRRFESLTVTENALARSLDPSVFESADTDPSGLVPTGFGSEALADAFAVTGEAARVDRGVLNDRRDAINRGDFLPPDFDPRNFPGGFAGLEGAFQGR